MLRRPARRIRRSRVLLQLLRWAASPLTPARPVPTRVIKETESERRDLWKLAAFSWKESFLKNPGLCDLGFPDGASGEEPAHQCRYKRPGFDFWVRKTPEGGPGSPLQYSCLENPMDRKAWWATAHRVAESWTQIKWLRRYIIHLDHAEFLKTVISQISVYPWIFIYLKKSSFAMLTNLSHNILIQGHSSFHVPWI